MRSCEKRPDLGPAEKAGPSVQEAPTGRTPARLRLRRFEPGSGSRSAITHLWGQATTWRGLLTSRLRR
jgi:hypothetical protein